MAGAGGGLLLDGDFARAAVGAGHQALVPTGGEMQFLDGGHRAERAADAAGNMSGCARIEFDRVPGFAHLIGGAPFGFCGG